MLAAGFTALGRDSGGMSMTISSEDRKYFEEMDELYVRRAMQMTDRFPFPFENLAREWLAERNEAQRPMREARQAKMAKQSEERLGQHGLQR